MLDATAVEKLSPEERRELYELELSRLDAAYRKDLHLWLEEQVWTVDEAGADTFRFPNRKDKPFIHEALDYLHEESLPVFPKSRRVMVSWSVAAYCVHRTRYFAANAVFWQSLNVEKAAYIVGRRCAWIEDHLDDPELRRPYKAHRVGSSGDIGRMEYLETKSYIVGIPQGEDAVRSFTGTILVMDEIDFQPEGPAALVAALPMVEKKAKLVLITSSNGPRGVVAGICKQVGFVRFS